MIKKVAIFLLFIAAVAAQKLAAQLPEASAAANPVWYYIQVQGEQPDRADLALTAAEGDSKVYGRSRATSTDEQSRQLWRFEQSGNGNGYAIVNMATGKMLDNAYYPAKNISIATLGDSPATRWKLLRSGAWYNIQATAAPAGGSAANVYLHQANNWDDRGYVVMLESSAYSSAVNSCFKLVPLVEPAPELVPELGTGIAPLWNPDRGLHLESIYQVDANGLLSNPYGRGAGQGAVGAEVYPAGFMDTRNDDFGSWSDSITLTQLYIYLTSFWDVDSISQVGQAHMQQLFDGLREKKVKAILRFAYSRDNGYLGNGHPNANPEYNRMLKHISQLKPILEKNFDVISFMEAGFLGTWGEWSPSYGTAEKNNTVINAWFTSVPKGYGMVVRYRGIKQNLCPTLSVEDCANRVGFANDYFTSGLKNCGSSDICMDSEEYEDVAAGSFTVFMRGEVPYNEGPPWGFDLLMEMGDMLRFFKDHHYTAMDITQNFTDNITYWKTLKVYPALLKKHGAFFDEAYFRQGDSTVSRTFYQHVRDHLGYRLNLQPSSSLTLRGDTLVYDLKITNTGFATVLNPRPVYLTLIDEAGQVVQEERLDVVNPRTWQPWAAGSPDSLLTHSISGSMALSLAAGAYKVGLWMPDSFESLKYTPAYCIKLATDNGAVAHWTDANHTRTVNIVGEVRVAEKLEPEKPSAAFATPAKNIKVYARNGYIRVDGTDSPPMVYNLMGAAVSASSRLPAGIYIVKVEGAVFKVIVN